MHLQLVILLTLTAVVLSCVDVLFVVDNRNLETHRRRAIQVARELPDNRKIRKWVAVSRMDRYVPRVVRNNAELVSVLDSVDGQFDRFLIVVSSEIARRTSKYQPLVILLFTEEQMKPEVVDMWRKMSAAPMLHIFRISSIKNPTKRIVSEEQTDFAELIRCGTNGGNLTFFENSSKFESTNEIRRSAARPFDNLAAGTSSTTHRPWTSTRDPYVRRLSYFDKSKTLLSTRPPMMTVTRSFTKLKTSRGFSSTSRTSSIDTLSTSTALPEIIGNEIVVRSRRVRIAPEHTDIEATTTTSTTTTTTRKTTTTSAFVPNSCRLELLFMVDLSQGTGDKSQQYFDIAASTISLLPISASAVRVGLIGFSGPGRSQLFVPIDKYSEKDELIEEMFKMRRQGGTTKTGQAIKFAIRAFNDRAHPVRRGVRKAIVVLTDGYSQDNPTEAAREARANGIDLFAVGVKDKLAPPDAQQLVDIGGSIKNVFVSPSGRALRDQLLSTRCHL